MRTEVFNGYLACPTYQCAYTCGDLCGLAGTWLAWLTSARTLAGTCGDLRALGFPGLPAHVHLRGSAGTCGHLACIGLLVLKMNMAHNKCFFPFKHNTIFYTLNLNKSITHLSWKLKMSTRWIKM
jgi:hypothetical protein